MVYSDFDLKTAVQIFGLAEAHDVDLFAGVEPIEPGDSLRTWLDELAPVAIGINSEKARSDRSPGDDRAVRPGSGVAPGYRRD